MASTAPARFDVAAFIDERPIGWREITTLVVVSVVLFIDGFDMYFFGKMLPAIADGLGVTPAGMTGVVFWQQVGMFAGAIVMPPLADRIGRKPVLALGLLAFGLLTLWAAWSTSVVMMAWLRGISGIFFSAMLPVALLSASPLTEASLSPSPSDMLASVAWSWSTSAPDWLLISISPEANTSPVT